MDDAELVQRLKSGDPHAFDRILERYQKPLYGYILGTVRDPSAAADLFQEVFMKLLEILDRYEERGHLRAWLFTTAHHLVADHFRGIHGDALQSLDATGEDTFSAAERMPSPQPGPEAVALAGELRERLETALARLSSEQREVFLLREFSGLPFRDIAEILGCPLGTVLARMSRAVNRLREELKDYDDRA